MINIFNNYKYKTYSTGEQKPIFRGLLHEIMAIILSICCFLDYYLFKIFSNITNFEFILFILSLIGLYTISSQFHRRTWDSKSEDIIRRLDHAMILFTISSCYMPLTLIMNYYDKIFFSIIIWFITISGIIHCFIKELEKSFGLISTYFCIMSCVSVVPFLIKLILFNNFFYYELFIYYIISWLTGIIGLFFYNLEKPNNMIFGYHEIFHSLIVIGNISTFIANYKISKFVL